MGGGGGLAGQIEILMVVEAGRTLHKIEDIFRICWCCDKNFKTIAYVSDY
jgi:hypothetical protein